METTEVTLYPGQQARYQVVARVNTCTIYREVWLDVWKFGWLVGWLLVCWP